MGISVWQILIVLLIVVLLFGTKKIRTLGGDLGEAVKGFKKGIQTDEEATDTAAAKSIEHSETETKEPVAPEFAQRDSSQKQASAS